MKQFDEKTKELLGILKVHVASLSIKKGDFWEEASVILMDIVKGKYDDDSSLVEKLKE